MKYNISSYLSFVFDEVQKNDIFPFKFDGRMQREFGLGLEHGVEQRRGHDFKVLGGERVPMSGNEIGTMFLESFGADFVGSGVKDDAI